MVTGLFLQLTRRVWSRRVTFRPFRRSELRVGRIKASPEALENAETFERVPDSFERIPDSMHQLGDSFERVADSIQRVANSRKQVPDSFTRTGVLVSKLATLLKEFAIVYMNSGRLCKEFPILCKVLATLSKEFAFSYVFSALEAPLSAVWRLINEVKNGFSRPFDILTSHF